MESSEEFPFPFPPYPIQNQFMKELYKCLEHAKLGIFESPTGTGKSMSIICGALKWLLDYEEFQKNELNTAISELDAKIKECTNSSDNWFSVQTLPNVLINKINENESIEEKLLLEDIQDSESSEEEDKEEEIYENTKIFFCSRTHSQLSQFIGELKKSPYSKTISVTSLASRQNYCINKNVKRLKHLNLINECCLQLQRKKVTVKDEKDIKRKKVASNCPFVPGSQDLLIGETLMQIQDVEEIVQRAENLKTCGYYASRKAIPHSQIILVPYNTILHKNTRISSGINLKGNILIIDEAHNLLEAIERMHSVMVTGRNLFQNLFSPKNVLSLSQLSFCLKKLLTVFGATIKSNSDDGINTETSPKLYKIEEFEILTGIDTLNIFELLKFIKNSRLSHKLQGFMEQNDINLKIYKHDTKTCGVKQFLNFIKTKSTESNISDTITDTISDEERSNNPIITIISFLECLQSCCADGRIFVIPGPTIGQSIIKFLLLNPAAHFHDIVQDARAVILAGGTMAPMNEFAEQLFIPAGAIPERIVTFSCDHVISEENIVCSITTHGPTGIEFEFNFQNRQNIKLVNEILEQYSLHVKRPQSPQNGSLLFSVVGGKLSEGLNFSDDLGRCVIVVGMPYPNVKSLELQEKIKYLKENVKSDAGQNFYENSCMKAVNQCIGRAIRHINDYSTVVLLDKRYTYKTKALPHWIQRTLIIHSTFGSMIGTIGKFFNKKKESHKKG
ncbi:putative ATP-dependent RNA helicase DDX11 [Habropoda laboriosa]|uniref:Putative ATP-dependent RNA helicase DDX11 n=1 Tax=Habropoda laboriosa TaxID=597456 RepID=A0A0L7QNI1_9HYME|nr:putative ATP-dependent RNA helicase DDX11 [Habropoda laboriosa]